MKDVNRMALAAAVAGGYVLGRTKKGRMAFAVGTYLAGRRAGLDPQKLMAQGMKTLKDAPQLAGLGDQVRGELMEAGRQALAATADRKMAGLADALHERTLRLEGRDEEDGADREAEAEDRAEEPEEEQEGARRERRSRGASAGKAAQKASAMTAPAKKAAAKKAPAKKAATTGKAAARRAPSGTDATSRSGTRRR
ncbi:hypothetical protein [Streptomyces kurssanovii]|uniref:Histone protein n=1 Tax=Streptomyces kurssanovii TaxID=67312 RepID=A0ABV3HXS6_9ACTN